MRRTSSHPPSPTSLWDSKLSPTKMTSARFILVAGIAVLGIVLGLTIGFFLGRGARSGQMTSASSTETDEWKGCLIPEDSKEWEYVLQHVNAASIRNFSQFLTKAPHLAGTEQDETLVHFIAKTFRGAGFDSVDLVPYNVLTSHPDTQNPNAVSHDVARSSRKSSVFFCNTLFIEQVMVVDETGGLVFNASYREKPVRDGDDHPNFVNAYNAYAPKADVTGELVYVNYARVEDFDELEKRFINVTGKICLARYGKIYRGNKLKNAELRGAIGIIMFSDPNDVALEGMYDKHIYPNTWWLPGTGIQRGNVRLPDGDPLTPGWPSLEHSYRLMEKDADLPRIPSQPIGYADAVKLLQLMDGQLPPSGWKGGLSNVQYRLGPGFKPNNENNARRVRLIVNNNLKHITSYNVIGRIHGAVEPDRYVMIGNHRDAWGFGAVDPSSGTAGLLETARVFGLMKKSGCRPRRTLVFCSWGAEEVGLIGSTEWVEQNEGLLRERAVAYVNTDVCTSGPHFEPKASPLLHDVLFEAIKKIPDPVNSNMSLYQTYAKDTPPGKDPEVGLLGSGTDHSAFAFHAGVSAIDFWFRFDKKQYSISMYPAYHTGYETFYMMDNIIDPGFKIHRGCSMFSVSVLSLLSDTHLLPLNVSRYAAGLEAALKNFNMGQNLEKIQKYNATQQLDYLNDAVVTFSQTISDWNDMIKKMDTSKDSVVRRLNDQMMAMERAFIMHNGLPERPHSLHALFAPSYHNAYSGAGLPGLTDLLFDADKLEGEAFNVRKVQLLKHLSDLYILTTQATKIFKPVEEI